MAWAVGLDVRVIYSRVVRRALTMCYILCLVLSAQRLTQQA